MQVKTHYSTVQVKLTVGETLKSLPFKLDDQLDIDKVKNMTTTEVSHVIICTRVAENGNITAGLALCSKDDDHDNKIGKKIALQRAKNAPMMELSFEHIMKMAFDQVKFRSKLHLTGVSYTSVKSMIAQSEEVAKEKAEEPTPMGEDVPVTTSVEAELEDCKDGEPQQ